MDFNGQVERFSGRNDDPVIVAIISGYPFLYVKTGESLRGDKIERFVRDLSDDGIIGRGIIFEEGRSGMAVKFLPGRAEDMRIVLRRMETGEMIPPGHNAIARARARAGVDQYEQARFKSLVLLVECEEGGVGVGWFALDFMNGPHVLRISSTREDIKTMQGVLCSKRGMPSVVKDNELDANKRDLFILENPRGAILALVRQGHLSVFLAQKALHEIRRQQAEDFRRIAEEILDRVQVRSAFFRNKLSCLSRRVRGLDA